MWTSNSAAWAFHHRTDMAFVILLFCTFRSAGAVILRRLEPPISVLHAAFVCTFLQAFPLGEMIRCPGWLNAVLTIREMLREDRISGRRAGCAVDKAARRLLHATSLDAVFSRRQRK